MRYQIRCEIESLQLMITVTTSSKFSLKSHLSRGLELHFKLAPDPVQLSFETLVTLSEINLTVHANYIFCNDSGGLVDKHHIFSEYLL
jgi:hypothetical protein